MQDVMYRKIMNELPGKLLVSRPHLSVNRLRKYKIFVDGERVGTINNDDFKVIQLPAGSKKVWVKIDWLKSNKKQIEIESGKKTRLSVGIHKTHIFKKIVYFLLFGLSIAIGGIFISSGPKIIGMLFAGLGGAFYAQATCRPQIN